MRPRLLSLVAFSLTASAMTVLLLLVIAADSLLFSAAYAQNLVPPSLLPAANQTPESATTGVGKDDIVEVVTQGMGIDQPSAMSNAYSNAVQQALGLYVDAETMVQNDQIVRDQILTYSKGFIQKVDIVSQKQANGLFQVNIRAQVKRQKLLEQAKANNITVKSVEGVNIHAQAVSQIKQEQDANALLTKALSPFTGVALYRADLVGEPKIVKKDQDSVTLAYPVSLYVDETAYNTAIRGLIDVLDKVASEKNEETGEYNRSRRDDVPKGEIWEVQFPPSSSRPLASKIQDYSDYRKKSLIAIMAWKDKSFTKSKWLFYNLPSDLSLKELKIPGTYNRIIVNLDLLNKGNELIALGNEVAASVNGSALQKPFQGDDYEVILKSYFSVDHIAYPKSQFEVNVTVSTQDLPTVQSAKLEVKMK
ncbi:MAG: hypothetical protein LAE24_11670 [Candidatus Contendobacter sp.]|nr:hypothetical protein [Candidatus Contendobacter sp.]